ncbi:hypothetical protein E4H04_12635 [Candidatus Bathyarchaeota archaeon]|nr:MAG: hypothetical protein E4H04_12635 [Candidatus Bathyarchaeota archaeon]
MELHWKSGTSYGIAELYVDGVKVCSAANLNTAAVGTASRVYFGLPYLYNCGSTTVYADDCVISHSYIGLR